MTIRWQTYQCRSIWSSKPMVQAEKLNVHMETGLPMDCSVHLWRVLDLGKPGLNSNSHWIMSLRCHSDWAFGVARGWPRDAHQMSILTVRLICGARPHQTAKCGPKRSLEDFPLGAHPNQSILCPNGGQSDSGVHLPVQVVVYPVDGQDFLLWGQGVWMARSSTPRMVRFSLELWFPVAVWSLP